MKSWFWLYQNEHFQEMFILIQPPTPLYQMEHFQDLLFLLQETSSNFFMAVQGPSSHQLGRPPGRLKGGVWGGGAPPVRKKFELFSGCPRSAWFIQRPMPPARNQVF